MSKKTPLASVARFAHLLGINPKAEEPEDNNDDAPVRMDGESDEDFAKRVEEYEEKEKAKKAKAEDDEDAAAEDEDEAGDDDDAGDKKEKAARKAERARCATIFGCAAAAVRQDMAAHLAFETDMTASAAIKMLGAIAAGQPKAIGLASRMAGVIVPVIGAEDESRSSSAPAGNASTLAANAILAAGRKARGEKA